MCVKGRKFKVNPEGFCGEEQWDGTDHGRRVGLPLPLSADLALDAFSDRQLTRSLADLCQIGSREAIGHLCQEVQVHILLKKRKRVSTMERLRRKQTFSLRNDVRRRLI